MVDSRGTLILTPREVTPSPPTFEPPFRAQILSGCKNSGAGLLPSHHTINGSIFAVGCFCVIFCHNLPHCGCVKNPMTNRPASHLWKEAWLWLAPEIRGLAPVSWGFARPTAPIWDGFGPVSCTAGASTLRSLERSLRCAPPQRAWSLLTRAGRSTVGLFSSQSSPQQVVVKVGSASVAGRRSLLGASSGWFGSPLPVY